MNNNNPQAGEGGGGGGKDFARDLTELMTMERWKNHWENTSIHLLNPDTALYPNWLDLQYLVQPDLASYHVSISCLVIKIDTRSHGLDKQNAIDMQIQSAKRNKNTSTRHSPFYKGTILIVKPSRQKCFVVNRKIDENS